MGDAFGRISRKEAAAALGCSINTMANWAVSGSGPKFHKTPTGRVYYLADDLKEYALRGAA